MSFTLLELCDLALRVPEVGAVNFNILHTVLTTLIAEGGLGGLMPPCHIEDETLAQAAITRARMERGEKKKGGEIRTVQEMRERMRTLDIPDPFGSSLETTPAEDEGELEEVVRSFLEGKLQEIQDSVEGTGGPSVVEQLVEQSAELSAEKSVAVSEAIRVLEEEELLEADPARLMEEMWRATNINRRMEAAEAGLKELSSIVDELLSTVQDIEDLSRDVLKRSKDMLEEISNFSERIGALEDARKTLSLGIEDANEQRAVEVERLEGLLRSMRRDHEETESALESLEGEHRDLLDRVAYKNELQALDEKIAEDLRAEAKNTRRLLREVEDTLVKKEDFAEALERLQLVEEDKVSRDELGRLLEPGFIDGFLEDQARLKTELQELGGKLDGLEHELEELRKRLDEEVLALMELSFAKIDARLEAIEAKLALLDPDEINDSFANLEEQGEMILGELEALKAATEAFQKEAKIYFGKITNATELLHRLEQTKADKSKMYQLLETKADLELIANKLDREEFASVVGDMRDDLERLTVTVKINEEESAASFVRLRQDLALKMYTEDFVCAVAPIRGSIRAALKELEAVKRTALQRLFPDAPGVLKCFSCNRAARLSGPRYAGDADGSSRTDSQEDAIRTSADESFRRVRFPAIDLDSLPIPPADQPREQDPEQLPLLFARAGLQAPWRSRK